MVSMVLSQYNSSKCFELWCHNSTLGISKSQSSMKSCLYWCSVITLQVLKWCTFRCTNGVSCTLTSVQQVLWCQLRCHNPTPGTWKSGLSKSSCLRWGSAGLSDVMMALRIKQTSTDLSKWLKMHYKMQSLSNLQVLIYERLIKWQFLNQHVTWGQMGSTGIFLRFFFLQNYYLFIICIITDISWIWYFPPQNYDWSLWIWFKARHSGHVMGERHLFSVNTTCKEWTFRCTS